MIMWAQEILLWLHYKVKRKYPWNERNVQNNLKKECRTRIIRKSLESLESCSANFSEKFQLDNFRFCAGFKSWNFVFWNNFILTGIIWCNTIMMQHNMIHCYDAMQYNTCLLSDFSQSTWPSLYELKKLLARQHNVKFIGVKTTQNQWNLNVISDFFLNKSWLWDLLPISKLFYPSLMRVQNRESNVL